MQPEFGRQHEQPVAGWLPPNFVKDGAAWDGGGAQRRYSLGDKIVVDTG